MKPVPDATPEERPHNWFLRVSACLSVVGVIAGGAALVSVAVIVGYDVVARFLGSPTLWATEIAGYLLIAVGTLGAGETMRRNEHFAMTLVVEALPAKVRESLSLVTSLIILGMVGSLLFGLVALLGNSLRFNLKSYTILQFPLAIPQLVLLVGFAILTVALVARVVGIVLQLASRPK